MSAFILVHLGKTYPQYLTQCIEQIRIFNPESPLYLVHDHDLAEIKVLRDQFKVEMVPFESLLPDQKIEYFIEYSTLNREFRGGLFYYAVLRLIAVERFMVKAGITDVVHLESDIAIYFELDRMIPLLKDIFPTLGITLESDKTCIPSVVYVASGEAFSGFSDYYLDKCIRSGPYDMEALASYHKISGIKSQLPIALEEHLPKHGWAWSRSLRVAKNPKLYWEHAAHFGGIFDAAAVGQFFGGVEPRNISGNTRGFVSANAVFSPKKMNIIWDQDSKGRRMPFVINKAGQRFALYNLHAHCKNLVPFMSKSQAPQ